MSDQETVEPEQDESVSTYDQLVEEPQETQDVEQEETRVPLHALQKERRKRQEAEERANFLEQQKKTAEQDESRYDSATKEDLSKTQNETIRIIEERKWVRDNPEKCKKIDDELPQFLKNRPNLASAIEASTNRYEEAWDLMSALTPKQQKKVMSQKQEAPGSPSGIPKSAALSETVDLMNMTDTEFNSWRLQKRGRK